MEARFCSILTLSISRRRNLNRNGFLLLCRSGPSCLSELNPTLQALPHPQPTSHHYSWRIEAGTSGDLAEESTLYDICLVFHHLSLSVSSFACMIVLIPIVYACFGTSSADAKNLLFASIVALCQIYTMCFLFKCFSWLIETDMSVMSESEQLKIHTAQ